MPGGSGLPVKVTVKLRQTTGVKLVSGAFNRIRISWKVVPGCNRYDIYRWDESGNSKKVATVAADVVTWQDTAVKTGSTYTYRIRASYVRSGKNTVYGATSSPLSAKAELGKARAVAEAVSGPCNRVSWKKVSRSQWLSYLPEAPGEKLGSDQNR